MAEKKEVQEVAKEMTKEEVYALEVAKEKTRLAQKVKIQLPKDNENYKDDVTVCINGKIWQIQRGVMVEVPVAVYEVLQQSSHQMMLAEARAAKVKDVRYDSD